jgi:glycosyltransferase involved in cell wall biosynthesis
VPCFNEEAGIPYLASSLRQLNEDLGGEYDLQFILIDDGSRDRTWDVLEQYFSSRPDTLLLRHPQNRGVSAAIMTGLEQAREIACSMDCDCSYDPNELKLMLRRLRDGVDLVTASPYHPAGSVLNVPGWRLLLSRCSCSLYRLVTGRKLYTFTACMRVYRRSATVQVPLRNSGFLGVAELISRLVLEGKQVVEHPATLEVRIFGQSNMKILRTIFGHLRLLTQLAWIRLQNRRAYIENSSRLSPQNAKSTTIASEVE